MHVYAKIRYSKRELRVQPSDFDMNMVNFFISNVDLSETLHMCCDCMWHVKQFFGMTVIIVTDTNYNPNEHYIIYDINSKGYGFISDLYAESTPQITHENKDQCGMWLDDMRIPLRKNTQSKREEIPKSFIGIILLTLQNFMNELLGLSLNFQG